MATRIGFGHDIHRLVPGRPLILGGVTMASNVGLLGHSDADVVLHALTDALLGTVGGPDIGTLFPDTDAQWKGADSRVFVDEALRRVHAAGYRVSNVDVTLLAQQPRLGSRKAEIAAKLAQILQVGPDAVAVKAGTNEGLDAVGRGEAIACYVAVCVCRRPRARATTA